LITSASNSTNQARDLPEDTFIGFHGIVSKKAPQFSTNGVAQQASNNTDAAEITLGQGLYVVDVLEVAKSHAHAAASNATNGTQSAGNSTQSAINGTSSAANSTVSGNNSTLSGDNSTLSSANSTQSATNGTLSTGNSTQSAGNSTQSSTNGTQATNSTAPMVVKLYAKNMTAWKNLSKVWLPPNMTQQTSEQERKTWAQQNQVQAQNASRGDFIRFAQLNGTSSGSQFVIPQSFLAELTAVVLDMDSEELSNQTINFQDVAQEWQVKGPVPGGHDDDCDE
jgi:hypothetical protein